MTSFLVQLDEDPAGEISRLLELKYQTYGRAVNILLGFSELLAGSSIF